MNPDLEENLPLQKHKSLTGRITRLFYSTPEFSTGVIRTKECGDVRFAGKLMVKTGDQIKFTGSWKNHPKYGWQFQVETLQHDLNLDAGGLAHYLKTNPAFKGIGPVKAGKIAENFGDDFDRALREDPERIRKTAGLTSNDMEILQREWKARTEFNSLSTWLAQYELTHNQTKRLIDKFGHSVKTILEEDPYILSREIDGFGFARTDQIAQKLGIPKEHPGRIQAALLHVVTQRAESGHCWTEERELVEMAANLLALDDMNYQEMIEGQLDLLIAEKESRLIGHNTGERMLIAPPTLYKREMDLADTFINRPADPMKLDKDLEELLESEADNLTLSQQKAVQMALTNRISLISGAAGSGKSYSIAAITRICEELDLDVALAAPTGKAAKRMEELTDCEAMTIHRLLGYNGRIWQHHAGAPLDYDLIILDEFSMVDIHLAWRFFDAVDLDHTQVVLVGDHNQLPPVGPGNILRDLIERKLIPTVILDQVVRQAGILKENCTAILDGQVRPTAPGTNGILRPWYVIDDLERDRAVVSALLHIVESKLAPLGIDPVKDLQILTPIKKGPLGVINLNIELQRLIQRLRFGVEVEPVSHGKRPPFYRGDKIMLIKNNYDIKVMNGTVGFIEDIRMEENESGKRSKVLIIDFDGHYVTIPINSEEAKDLQLAYACTIHKYQGSEVLCALTIVHSSHYFMLHRNLLYTAVTRSRNVSILLGNRKGIKSAAARQVVEQRKTFLSVFDVPKRK